MLIILSIGIIFMFRLFYIQVINDEWAERASQISSKFENLQPPRGFIYDRNGELLVGVEKVYDIYMLPAGIKEADSAKICNLFNITIQELREIIENASNGYNVPYKSSRRYRLRSKGTNIDGRPSRDRDRQRGRNRNRNSSRGGGGRRR